MLYFCALVPTYLLPQGHIFNLSFISGKILKIWKVAQVIPCLVIPSDFMDDVLLSKNPGVPKNIAASAVRI